MRILLTISLLFLLINAYSSQIPGGIWTKDITVWRYWEKTETGYKYKMIVFNNSDRTINFSLKQAVYLGNHMILDTTKNKIFAGPKKIKKYKYIIIDLPSSTEYQEFMDFILNEKRAGTLGLNKIQPPKNLPSGRYCSNEGLNGREGLFWISKNNLATKPNQIDSMVLHINYQERPYYGDDGIHLFIIRPLQNINFFNATLNSNDIGSFNDKQEYIFELPYLSEYDEVNKKFLLQNIKTDIIITYVATNPYQFLLGLNISSGINLRKGKTLEELRKKMYPSSRFDLPIIVLKE